MNKPMTFEQFVESVGGIHSRFSIKEAYNIYLLGRLDGAMSHTKLNVKEKTDDA